MVVISRRLISQIAASAAALVVTAAPTSGIALGGAAQPGVHADQASTGGTTLQANDRSAVARQIPSPAAGRHDVDPNVLHHWYP